MSAEPQNPTLDQTAPVLTPQQKRAQDDKEFLLHLSIPSPWTETHYTIYTNAESAALIRGVDPTLAQYYGVLALFRSQDVRVVELPALQEMLSKKDADQMFVPLAVKGALIRAVAKPLEAEVNQPFLDLLKA